MCWECSKESPQDGSFEYPQHMFWFKNKNVHSLGLFQKNTWEGNTAGNIFFYGWLVRKVFKLMGHWCPTKSNNMGGWYWVEGKKEYYLPKKIEMFYQI